MNTTINILIPILVPAIGTMLAALIGLVAAYVRTKTRSLEMRDAITMAEQTVSDVVAEVQQTFVDPRKRLDLEHLHARATGTTAQLPESERVQGWTEEAAGIAKAQAVMTVAKHLGSKVMAVLDRELNGGVQAWIATKVEAEVARNK
jgi:hypothetical protein